MFDMLLKLKSKNSNSIRLSIPIISVMRFWLRSKYTKLIHLGKEPKEVICLWVNSKSNIVSKSNEPVTAFIYSSYNVAFNIFLFFSFYFLN